MQLLKLKKPIIKINRNMILNKYCIYIFDLNNSYRDITVARITNWPVLHIIPLL